MDFSLHSYCPLESALGSLAGSLHHLMRHQSTSHSQFLLLDWDQQLLSFVGKSLFWLSQLVSHLHVFCLIFLYQHSIVVLLNPFTIISSQNCKNTLLFLWIVTNWFLISYIILTPNIKESHCLLLQPHNSSSHHVLNIGAQLSCNITQAM